jgi:alanyl-tRNA synthetase
VDEVHGSTERLWITVHVDDDEAERLWLERGVPRERIRRFDEENFWGPAGDSGPCGPDSEIHYDFGAERCAEKHSEAELRSGQCGPNVDCGRFLELWNLVFIQYDQDREKRRTPLAKKNIDTGMGLDRLTTILQGGPSPYETDLFEPIIGKVVELTGRDYYEGDEPTKRAIRIVAEHARAATFLIADGLIPGNEGRGYVLRRLIRRALYFAARQVFSGDFLKVEDFALPKQSLLDPIAERVIYAVKGHYPDVDHQREFIRKTVNLEEDRFRATVRQGRRLLLDSITVRQQIAEVRPNDDDLGQWLNSIRQIRNDIAHGRNQFTYDNPAILTTLERLVGSSGVQELEGYISTLSGSEVFLLHDTFGFPLELSAEIASEHELDVDREGFERLMEEQRERSVPAVKRR